MSEVAELARAKYVERQLLARRTVLAVRNAWSRINADAIRATWALDVAAEVYSIVTAAQLESASTAQVSTAALLAAQGIASAPRGDVLPRSLVGIASDGRNLTSLLELATFDTLAAINDGRTAAQGLAIGGQHLELITGTQVVDAGRVADGIATVAQPDVGGYVRMLNLPSCARCAILAGRFYRWNKGFLRHPRCDCLHIPASENVAGDLTTNAMAAFKSGKVTGLSQPDIAAINDGSDIAQVVNAHRGMEIAAPFGKRIAATREGAGRRGVPKIRLMPEQIYKEAKGDRNEALRLLRLHGYLTH